jgi:Fe-S cluster biogenesis protein NfuA
MSEELMTKVQDLIENMINPAVAGHGGFVQLVDVKDNKVYLQMGGGCQGCGAALLGVGLLIDFPATLLLRPVTSAISRTRT